MSVAQPKQATDGAGFYVVFEHTAESGGYEGVRTISRIASEAELENFLAEVGKKRPHVLDRCATLVEASAIAKRTPMLSYIGSAVEDAVGPDGIFHPERFQAKMLAVGIEVGLWGKRDGVPVE